MTRLTTLNLPHLHKATIGFDRLFNELERGFANSPNGNGYPPYNIEQLNEDEFIISLAVAGFSMDNLEITKDGNLLTVEGTMPEADEKTTYLHKGISSRKFSREFTLADHVEVKHASLDLGMLYIGLVREVPESLKPKKIAINNDGVIDHKE
jgi:molecular chaperone IbpA